MKKISLFCAIALAGLSLTACGNSSHKKNTTSKQTSSKVVKKHHKKKTNKHSKNKQASSSSAVSASNQQNNQQQQTQTSKANTTSQSNNNGNSNQDQRPADVPANFKEYTSYTTDGHRMTQWNDAGSYCGDPDVQYDTIRQQTEAGF